MIPTMTAAAQNCGGCRARVVVDVVVAQQPEIRKTGRKQKRYEADRTRSTICAISRKTLSACAAPNRKALLALSVTPCVMPTPTAIRHAVSTAVIATISDPPRIKVMIPTGVVKKNMAISTSATTRSDVPDRSQHNSQVVAGVRIAKAINLYATSVIRHAAPRPKKIAGGAGKKRSDCIPHRSALFLLDGWVRIGKDNPQRARSKHPEAVYCRAATQRREHRGDPHVPFERNGKMKVGFIGLGRMGKGMAHRIQGGGHELTVFDVVP